MEKFRVVDENFKADVQKLPEGFDVIGAEERRFLLNLFSILSPIEAQVGWNMFANLPEEIVAIEHGLTRDEVAEIRNDVHSFLAHSPQRAIPKEIDLR